MTLRVVFMGTPDFAVPCLSEIIGAGHEIAAVYTQPPRPAGRGMEARKSPVHNFADKAGLDVRHPKGLRKPERQAAFADLAADVAVVVAYGLILPKPILDAPRYGCLNLHGSLLPRWRGAAPIQRAIMAGDKTSGVMVMQMDEGLDTGGICLADQMMIGPDMTAGELHDDLMQRGADLIVRALAALERGSLECKAQSEDGVTYAQKIEKSETRINWELAAHDVHNHMRGLSPWPGAWFEADLGAGKKERVKVIRSALSAKHANHNAPPGTLLDADNLIIACGSGAVQLLHVQRAGKKAMGTEDFLRGAQLAQGAQFS